MMLKQEITVWAALTIGSASVYHFIRGNVDKLSESGSVVSSLEPSVPTLLSGHMSTGNLRLHPLRLIKKAE
jgi:hypothetical protein